MRSVLIVSLLIASQLHISQVSAQDDNRFIDGKRILHVSEQEEKTWTICNHDEKKPVLQVFLGPQERVETVKYGECKEFTSKQISVEHSGRRER